MTLLRSLLIAAILFFPLGAGAATGDAPDERALDERELLVLPDEGARIEMLAAMRDHLVALDEMIEAIALGDFEQAGGVASTRLGRAGPDGPALGDIAADLPLPMREMEEVLHDAAGRFVMAAQEARTGRGGAIETMFMALQDVTAACVACHSAYRLR